MALDANRMPVLFDPEIAWRIGGEALITNGTAFEVESDEAVKELTFLNGRRLRIARSFGETPRVHGQKTVRVEFPRVDRAFYEQLRMLQEFGEAVTLELKLLDAEVPVALTTDDRIAWYAPHRSLTRVRVHLADIDAQPIAFAEVPTGWTLDAAEGRILFSEPRPMNEVLFASYVWSPVVRVFDLTPRDVPGEADSIYKPKVTLKEVS